MWGVRVKLCEGLKRVNCVWGERYKLCVWRKRRCVWGDKELRFCLVEWAWLLT